MTDASIARDLIRIFVRKKYPKLKHEEGEKSAIKDLTRCKEKHGFPAMKKAYLSGDWRGIDQFYKLLKKYKHGTNCN